MVNKREGRGLGWGESCLWPSNSYGVMGLKANKVVFLGG